MPRVTDPEEATARIEAALYSAGRPLQIEDLVRASGTESKTRTLDLLGRLIRRTRSVFRALEIATLPDGSYVFQLKPEYSAIIRTYASKPLLSKAVMRTLSYIAYSQPVSSKQLVEVRGSGVYAHLKELRQKDYIGGQSVGRLKVYTTTATFQKYFGLQGESDIRQHLFSKVRQIPGKSMVPAGRIP